MTAAETLAPRSITVRDPHLGLTPDVPAHWYRGRPGVTHFTNALGALFPEGERFFVRSVQPYVERVEDPALREDVKRFIAQEVRHGAEHDHFNDVLKAQGLDLSRFFWLFRRVCRAPAPRFTRKLWLSVTVAVEHMTAVAARHGLGTQTMQGADPRVQRLYEWHALEELEHKAVAFDVLRAAGGGYLLRMLGFFLVVTHAPLFIGIPFLWLLARAGLLFSPRPYFDVLRWGFFEGHFWAFARGLAPYLRPSFHPEQDDDGPLFEKYRAAFN